MQYWLPNITSRIDSILVVILTLSSLNFYFIFLYSVYFDSSRDLSRSTYSYNFDETLLAELAGGTPSDPRKNHVLYQACPDRLLHRVHSWTNDLDHVLQVMRNAPVQTEPFKFSSFMCDIWPPELYSDMLQYYPSIVEDMIDLKYPKGKSPCLFHSHCEGVSNDKSCHTEFDLSDILALKNIYNNVTLERIISTWTRVLNVLNSEEIADLLWQKLNVLEKRETKQIRIINKLPTPHSDVIHSDSPHTIATIIFMFPNALDEVFEYGTCLYSPRKEYKRSMSNPSNCSHQVRFFPNSAFMFRTVPGKVGGRFYYNPKYKDITFGKEVRTIYYNKNISFPSWHSTPLMQYNDKCEVKWRRSLFLTFNCTNRCWQKWKEGKYTKISI